MFLTSPDNPLASYLQLPALKADGTLDLVDRNGNLLSDATLNALLEESSGEIDTLIGQSFLPCQATLKVKGQGSNVLNLNRNPLIYVRQIKLALPTTVGFDIPPNSLLIDQWTGMLVNITPLTFQGVGITTLFPKGTEIDVTCAWGIGYAIAPPTFTASPITGPAGIGLGAQVPLAPGVHSIQLTSVTVSGESLPSPAQNVTLVNGQGAIQVTVTNSPGAMKYYAYDGGVFVGEIQGYAIGAGVVSLQFNGAPPTSPIAYNFDGTPKKVPTIDTSAIPFQGSYAALPRLCKLLVQLACWESRNVSNIGISSQASGPKRVTFRDNLHSTYAKKIDDLVASLQYQAIV